MHFPLEFIDTGAQTGEWNMRFDLERAEALDNGNAVPMVRVYRWKPWCISLGRFQNENDIDAALAKRDGIDIVRRPTGGRAILHAEELTYSVVMPSENRSIMDVYKTISEALSLGLNYIVPNISMAKSQPDFQKLYREAGSIPCFSSSARYEIEHGGRKLVGSAQRRIGSTVLQHGSILIGNAHLHLSDYLTVSEETRAQLKQDMLNHTVTLNEIAGRNVSYHELTDALRNGIQTAWDMSFTELGKNPYISSREKQEAIS